MKKIKSSLIVLLLSVIATISVSVSAFASPLLGKVNKSTKFVFISDSGAVTPKDDVKNTWPYRFDRYMGLGKGSVCISKRSGTGYAVKDYQFITMVKKLPSSKNVKYVTIMGGVNNDKQYTLQQIGKEMKKLNKVIRKKFPNATICFGIPNYASAVDPVRIQRAKERKPEYKRMGTALGWKYLNNVSTVLERNTGWWIADNHHPNAYGGRLIAEEMYDCFKKYAKTYRVTFDANGGTGNMINRYYKIGKAYKLPKNAFSRPGYKFQYWKIGNKKYKNLAKIKNLTTRGKTVTFKAVWKRDKNYKAPVQQPPVPAVVAPTPSTENQDLSAQNGNTPPQGYTGEGSASGEQDPSLSGEQEGVTPPQGYTGPENSGTSGGQGQSLSGEQEGVTPPQGYTGPENSGTSDGQGQSLSGEQEGVTPPQGYTGPENSGTSGGQGQSLSGELGGVTPPQGYTP